MVRIGGNGFFLILILFLYLITLFLNKNLFIESLIYAKDVMVEMIPILVTVFVLMFLANIWFINKKANKLLIRKTGISQYMAAIILGIISSGPIYMWYPLLGELKEKGLKNSLIAVFLYNRAVKVPLMPMIVYYFGLPFLLVTTCLMILFSLVNGYFVAKFVTD